MLKLGIGFFSKYNTSVGKIAEKAVCRSAFLTNWNRKNHYNVE